MIVVIGSPVAQHNAAGAGASGLPVLVARAASAAGGAVQVVGRVGEDPEGDAVLLDLAAAGVGHVAILREPGRPTPVAGPPRDQGASPDEAPLGRAIVDDDAEHADTTATAIGNGLSLDAADLDLALRYLPDYRVVVLACDLDERARSTVVGAAGWAGAHLIAIVSGAADAAGLPADATVLDRPAGEAEGALASVVAAYAVALDRGAEPSAAFAEAVAGGSWAAVTKGAENPSA